MHDSKMMQHLVSGPHFDLIAGGKPEEDTIKKQFEYGVVVNVLKAFASKHHISRPKLRVVPFLRKEKVFAKLIALLESLKQNERYLPD